MTDYTNASRTLLFNIHTLTWDEMFENSWISPPSMLPEVRSNSEIYGWVDSQLVGGEIPIAGSAGNKPQLFRTGLLLRDKLKTPMAPVVFF